jgi:uncharacterized membrane protein YqjE
MAASDQDTPGSLSSFRRLLAALVGLVRNRVELFALELQEQELRFIELLMLVGAALGLGLLALALFSAVFIFLFSEPLRIYAAAGLGVLYLAGVAAVVFRIKWWLREKPFAESIAQVRKDFECLTPPR